MLVLLPPSETKRDGGAEGSALDLRALSFPELAKQRLAALAALRALSRNLTAATAGLRLGVTQRFEVDRNRMVSSSPVMPAVDRYTGVLYDALEADSLTTEQRSFANEHVVIHSALFGLIRALDPIPAYRLSHDSRLPQLRLRQVWSGPIAQILADYRGLIVDLRSDGYAALGPRPERADSVVVRVVVNDGDGRRRSLNHFNKKAKGEFVREVLESGVDHDSADSLCRWAMSRGIRLERSRPGELELVV